MRTTVALLSAALLLLLLPGTLTQQNGPVPIDVVVENSVDDSAPQLFSTYVVYRGVLLGGLRRLMETNANFKFTFKDDPNYGPFLESVNGVAGNDKDRTYWEFLVETPEGENIRPDIGIGCYIPSANETITLKFTKY